MTNFLCKHFSPGFPGHWIFGCTRYASAINYYTAKTVISCKSPIQSLGKKTHLLLMH